MKTRKYCAEKSIRLKANIFYEPCLPFESTNLFHCASRLIVTLNFMFSYDTLIIPQRHAIKYNSEWKGRKCCTKVTTKFIITQLAVIEQNSHVSTGDRKRDCMLTHTHTHTYCERLTISFAKCKHVIYSLNPIISISIKSNEFVDFLRNKTHKNYQ